MPIRRTVRCSACRSDIPYSDEQAGTHGRCPVCDGAVVFPQVARLSFQCANCSALLKAPADRAGARMPCPKCGVTVTVPRPSAARPAQAPLVQLTEDDLTLQQDDEAPQHEAFTSETRRADLAWREFENARGPSYNQALWRAPLYPFQVMGGILIFVIGIPLAVSVMQLLLDELLYAAAAPKATATHALWASRGAAALTIWAILMAASLVASFLFVLIQSTARGSDSVPLIQGQPHRNNLALIVAWGVTWFGLPALAGFSTNGTWQATLPALVLFAFAAIPAMAGFIAISMNGPRGVFGFRAVERIISAEPAAFLQAILAGVASGGVFVLLRHLLQGLTADMAPEDWTGRLALFGIRFVCSMFMVFPVVALVRALGLYVRYHLTGMPRAADTAMARPSPVMKLLFVAGCLMAFVPLSENGARVIQNNRLMAQVGWNLQRIGERSMQDGRLMLPRSQAELARRFPALAACPFAPDEEVGYEVENLPHSAPTTLMAIYPKKPHPATGRWSVLFNSQFVRQNISDATFRKLKVFQQRVLENPKDTALQFEMQNVALYGR